MSHNLADLDKDERDKIDVDLQASGVAYKERYDMPFSLREIESNIPANLRDYFHERLEHYRAISKTLSKMPYNPEK